jgi:hypothetical protein
MLQAWHQVRLLAFSSPGSWLVLFAELVLFAGHGVGNKFWFLWYARALFIGSCWVPWADVMLWLPQPAFEKQCAKVAAAVTVNLGQVDLEDVQLLPQV